MQTHPESSINLPPGKVKKINKLTEFHVDGARMSAYAMPAVAPPQIFMD